MIPARSGTISLFTLILIALAMTTDAFAVAVSRGVALKRPNWKIALKNGMLFGLTETITPLLGWLVGGVAVKYVSQWDHWIIFGLLLVLGLRMIKSGLSRREEESSAEPGKKSFIVLLLMAISTSLDSFALGVSFAFAEVNIIMAACMIGFATFCMATLGIMLGRKLGEMVGKRAEIMGGAVLILIGLWTLYDHMM